MADSAPPLLPNATRDLAEFAAQLQFDMLPPEVVERMKLCILDSIGCCAFGATLPWTRKVAEYVQAEGGQPVASVFGAGFKTSVSQAVLVNGTAGHAFELDDIHKESIVHPGSLALPVALALAEADRRLTSRDVLTAMVAGYEVGTRVGNAATMSLFFRGFHPQGTSGAFVAAATAGRLLRLSPQRMQHALGIVGSQAGGLMAAQEGAMVKRLHSGRAGQSGIYAASLASRDFTGIVDVLEAAYGGYLSTYSGSPNPKRLTDGLGTSWETLQVGYKPHASVTSIHAALDALAGLMASHDLSADHIASVDVGVSSMTYVHCAWPYKSQGVTAAQMNLFYGLAVIAVDGKAFVDQYREDRLADPRLLDFIGRITARADPEIDAMGPSFRHASRVVVSTREGARLTAEVLHRRGSPENPLTPDDVVFKFRNVAGACMPTEHVERLIELTKGFDKLITLGEICELLGSAFADGAR